MSISVNANTQNKEVRATSAAEQLSASRTRQNASIIQASMDVSISARNEPMALLFRTAIDSLNEILKPELGENAIQNAASQDNSPEATAGRIVSLSTGFYEAYKKQHPGEDAAAVLQDFMNTIREGFERGYKEAVQILEGLKVFDGDIAAGIQQTYDLVLQGYADFEQAQAAMIADA